MRRIFLSGTSLARWNGVRVFRQSGASFTDVTANWNWSTTPHNHYEVRQLAAPAGSWWVPSTTHPPLNWQTPLEIVGTSPAGQYPVDPQHKEFRPRDVYIWIPAESMPNVQNNSNRVICEAPTAYPPVAEFLMQAEGGAHAMLSRLLDPAPTSNSFQDADGLISFVNLSSSFVTSNPEFTVGQSVCDKVSNFFSTLRIKTFGALKAKTVPLLPGDTMPTTQWDPSVTHFMQHLLTQAGGLTNFKIENETFSNTQVITEFSTSFVKLLFDAAVVPEAVIGDVTDFLQSVGESLRASWDDRSRTYQTAILAQCHEAVQEDESGKNFRYFPKIKYYYISIESHQQEFTSPCNRTEYITFNFTYRYYVTGLAADVLNPSTSLYTQFVTNFLEKAQAVNFKDATNNLNSLLEGTKSDTPPSVTGTSERDLGNIFGVNLKMYPRVEVAEPSDLGKLEQLLNQR